MIGPSDPSACCSWLQDARRLGLAALGGQATVLLVLPGGDLRALQQACTLHLMQLLDGCPSGPQRAALEAMGPSPRLSTNDVFAGLLWLVCCSVRGRPLPGQPVKEQAGGGPKTRGGMFGMAVDLRFNCPPGALPHTFVGNAACAIHVRSSAAAPFLCSVPATSAPGGVRAGSGGLRVQPWFGPRDTDEMVEASLESARPSPPPSAPTLLPPGAVSLLSAAAGAVHGAVSELRSLGPSLAPRVLRSYASHANASTLHQVSAACRMRARNRERRKETGGWGMGDARGPSRDGRTWTPQTRTHPSPPPPPSPPTHNALPLAGRDSGILCGIL